VSCGAVEAGDGAVQAALLALARQRAEHDGQEEDEREARTRSHEPAPFFFSRTQSRVTCLRSQETPSRVFVGRHDGGSCDPQDPALQVPVALFLAREVVSSRPDRLLCGDSSIQSHVQPTSHPLQE
jgi:hypothetical protein